MKQIHYNDLTSDEKKLINSAVDALQYAYNPYTNHLFGAAVETKSGKIIQGGNFLISVTGVNVCAERAAIITANSQGERNITKLAVVGDSDKNDEAFTPCGICRQFIFGLTEITGEDITIFCVSKEKSKIMKTSIYDLFPSPYFSK